MKGVESVIKIGDKFFNRTVLYAINLSSRRIFDIVVLGIHLIERKQLHMIEVKHIIVVMNIFLDFRILLLRPQVNVLIFVIVPIVNSTTSFVIDSLEVIFLPFSEPLSLTFSSNSEALFSHGCMLITTDVTDNSSLTVDSIKKRMNS